MKKEWDGVFERFQFFAAICGEGCEVREGYGLADAGLTDNDDICISG